MLHVCMTKDEIDNKANGRFIFRATDEIITLMNQIPEGRFKTQSEMLRHVIRIGLIETLREDVGSGGKKI